MRPSDLHRKRGNDPVTGKFRGFNNNPKFSRNVLVIFYINENPDNFGFKLLSIDLDLTGEAKMQRGVPYIVVYKVGHEIDQYLIEVSAAWGTVLRYN